MLNYEAEKRVHARIQAESSWRESLSQGDYLDALAKYKTPHSTSYNFITGWAHAKIIDIDPK